MPYLTHPLDSSLAKLCELSLHYYAITNWLVRNAILKAALKLITLYSESDANFIKFIEQIIQNVADLGEKYDTNMIVVADIMLEFTDKFWSHRGLQSEDNVRKILGIIKERNNEDITKNLDLINRNIN